jgi:molecular chaperone DnaK (HSP70)
VVAGTVIMVGRYSWKALNRMDTEWEDYLWELKRYERSRLDAAADATITVGVDLGTFYLKLSRMNKNNPELIETAQGDRYRFNGILHQDNGDVVMGQTALEKFFYRVNTANSEQTTTSSSSNSTSNSEVVLPYIELQQQTHDDATTLVQKVFVPAVSEAMERVISERGDAFQDEEKNLRTVLTLPPVFYNKHGDELFRKNYHDDSHHTITVPEPVAAIWGAQTLNLVPTPKSKEEHTTSSTMVVDIGGLASTISLVRDDKVVASVSLDGIGGESLVQCLVDRIVAETGDETMAKDEMSLTMIQSSARSSVLELVNKTQSKIHIPFLYMGRKPDDPHLETTISRTVLERAVQDGWNANVVPKLVSEENVLSSSLPTPKDVTSLFTSAVTQVLEESSELPTNIEQILLVGGGSRHKMFEDAFQESITALMGPANFQDKAVIPESSMRAELTALGASSLLPNFDYDYEHGLERL